MEFWLKTFDCGVLQNARSCRERGVKQSPLLAHSRSTFSILHLSSKLARVKQSRDRMKRTFSVRTVPKRRFPDASPTQIDEQIAIGLAIWVIPRDTCSVKCISGLLVQR